MIASRNLIQQHVPGDAKARSRWARMAASSQRFYYCRFKLLNPAVPVELGNIMANATERPVPLVVDSNDFGYGKTAVGTPKCVIVAGAVLRKKLLSQGAIYAMGWVGEKALQAAGVGVLDGISTDELSQKLSAALRNKFEKGVTDPYTFSGPYIVTIYPFDNYVVYNLGTQMYRIDYTVNTTDRTVDLTGTPKEVEQEYVQVASSAMPVIGNYGLGNLESFDLRTKAPYAPVGVRIDPTLVLPSLFTVSLGAVNSELRNPAFGPGFLNVDAVVAAYLDNVRNGYHKPILPPPAPIPNVRMLFAKELRARGVYTPADLMQWVGTDAGQAAIKAASKKSVSGDPVDAKDFAHVGDPKDKSTWKLPIHDKSHVRNAMSRFDQADIPDAAKPKAAKKIVNRAKNMGIDSDNFAKGQGMTIDTDDSDVSSATEKCASCGNPKGNMNGKLCNVCVAMGKRVKATGMTSEASDRAMVAGQKFVKHIAKAKTANDIHDQVAKHTGRAFNAFMRNDIPNGKAHMTRAKNTWQGRNQVKAGGPGSGPHGSGSADSADTDAGKTDAYGYTHNKAAADATADAAAGAGFKDVTEPFMKERGLRSFSNSSTGHHVWVNPDGSWIHTTNNSQWGRGGGTGKSAASLKSESFK